MKILITGPSWVGDMVMSQSLYRHLKLQYPDCHIDILAPAWCLAVTERMPEINQSIELPFKHGQLSLFKRHQFAKQLRAERYDWAIILPNSFKSALISWWAKIPKRTGWRGEMRYMALNDIHRLDKKALPLMVQRFVALAYQNPDQWSPDQILPPSLIAKTEDIPDIVDQYQLNIPPQQPVLALCPGAAFGTAKRWPSHYFAEVANQKLQQGWQVWLLGSPSETAVLDDIQQQTDHRCQLLAGQVSLAHKIDLLSLASVVISNDSGLLHVAAALQKPTIAIYGSTTPDFTPPLSANSKILQIDNLACRPCFKRDCPLKAGQLKCLYDITPQQVSAAIEQLMSHN